MINKFEGNKDRNTRLTFLFTSLIIKPVEISTQLSDNLKHSSAAFKFISTVQMESLDIDFES